MNTAIQTEVNPNNRVYIRDGYVFVEFDFAWPYVQAMQTLKCIDGWKYNKRGSSGWSFPIGSFASVREAMTSIAHEFTWDPDLPSGMQVITYRGKKPLAVQDNNGLKLEQIQPVCPSVFAEVPHHSRSDSYQFISTIQVLEDLQEKGYVTTYATQSPTTLPDRQDFTPHLLRLRHERYLGFDEAPEIILFNAHDGSAAYRLLSGFFRSVCRNGLVTGDIFHSIRVRHYGNILDQVFQAIVRITEESKEMVRVIDAMRQIQLSRPEQLQLAQFAISQRYPQEKNEVVGSIVRPTSEDYLQIKRDADRASSLWNIYNRIQEWMIMGGVRLSNGRLTQAIHGIDKNLLLNSLLWMEVHRLFAQVR